LFAYGLTITGPAYWPDGSSVFAGFFCGTLIVAPGEPNETELVSEPPECGGPDGPAVGDAIMMRYAPDGSLEWLLAPVTPGYVGFYGAHVTPSGRIQVVGQASESLELVDTHGDVASIDGPSYFVAAFEQDGELVWLRHIESEYGAPVSAVTLDGEVVLVGQMYDSVVVVDAGLDGEEMLTGRGIYGIQYDASGELKWAAMLVDGQTYMAQLHVSVGDGVFAVAGGFELEAVLVPGGVDEQMLSAEVFDRFVALFELE
jgi:hypothetical protein